MCLMMELQKINSQCSIPSLDHEEGYVGAEVLQSEGREMNLINCV